jgi:hypothetical protein
MFRVSRDARVLARAARQDPETLWRLAYWSAPSRDDLLVARTQRSLHDPADERLVSLRQRRRTVAMRRYETSAYVYSQHQLIMLPTIQAALPFFDRTTPRAEYDPIKLKTPRQWQRRATDRCVRLRDIVIAATVLEPAYYPRVTGRLKLAGHEDIGKYDQWRRNLSATSLLAWLGVDEHWVAQAASTLLQEADRIDPLRAWIEIVARADPEKWTELRGSARGAMDLRTTAELFLQLHDDLVNQGEAQAVGLQDTRVRGPFSRRLKATRPLDEVLTEFGLSPHPRLVLVVEGATELLLIPRAMELLDVSTDEDFISVQNAEGVERDLSTLLGFLAPRVKPDVQGRYLDLIRPPTRFLIVFDPEGRVSTEEGRKKRRKAWVERIQRAIPGESNNKVVAEQIDGLVELMTWNRRGDSFEFAHFTDREIAQAVLRLPRLGRSQTLEAATATVKKLRAAHGNLETMFRQSTKGRLAEELRPVLERKLKRAKERGTLERISLVAVLDRAIELAIEYPRRNLVIGLSK